MSIGRKYTPFGVMVILLLLLFIIILIHDHAYLGRLDYEILFHFNNNRIRRLDKLFQFVTDINTTVTFITIGGILLLSYIRKSKAILFKAIGAGSALLTTTVITSAMKELINRDRPFLTFSTIERLTTVVTPSFPSGHTSEAFALATIVSLFFPDLRIVIVAYSWALLIAYSRMLLGVHYPTDIISAMLLGATVSLLVWIIFRHRTDAGKPNEYLHEKNS